MSLSVKSHADRFLEYLEKKNPEAAYTRAEACLLQSKVDQEELYQICTHLDTLLDQISSEQAESLLLHLLKTLQEFPVFAEEQAHTLTRYGEICLSKSDSLSAMRCFATAHVRNPSHESAQRLLSPLFPSIFEGLETQLQRATGLGDPALFQQLLMQFTHKFGIDTPSVQQIYQIAERVYKGIQNPNTKMLFIDLLDEIEAGMDGRSPPRANPLPYLQHLQQVREGFEDQTTTRQYQKERAEAFCSFFQNLFQDALFILGEPPCGYDIRAMGSLAREEVCPYSDLEYFILIEEEQHRPYFQKLAKIFDLQILSLGETDPKHQELFNFGQKFGLEIDHQANPATHDSLIGIPEQLFALPQEPSSDDLKAYKSRLRSVSLQRNHEFDLPQPALDIRVLLEMRKGEFASLTPIQGTVCEVKREFVEPLFHFISDLGLYFGVEESNTLDLIEKLPLFDPLSKFLLKEAVATLYYIRIRIHLAYGGIIEQASLIPSLELPVVNEEEALTRIRDLVLAPLYQLDLEEREQELLHFASQTPNVVEQMAAFLQNAPIEIHRIYYQKLEATDQRVRYLKFFPQHVNALAEIPNRAGFRYSRLLEQEELTVSLQRITTDSSTSGVKIRSPLIGENYLTQEAAKALIDKKGHIFHSYADSLHRVSAFQDLHFKELPYQPLMEYAIHSLWHRIMGKATPFTTLARIEIPDKKLVYPVIISETIQGQKLDHPSRLNPEHLTWMRLCEILTKPGDGRFSNYLLRLGKIYCIDNDISFMEPVAKTKGQRKVTFCSSLFTLDLPLVPEVLTQFCALEPDLILTDWIEELQEQERLYCSLFSEAELQTFYTQDKDRRFSPTLMLAKGTIATLCMQFYHLQDVLRQGVFTDPSLLLRELISLDESTRNRVGILVERNYRKSLTKPFASRLKEATAVRADQSMTSQKAMELNYKTIPTFEEIQTRKTYSLEEALKELCLLEAQKMWNQVFIIGNREEYSLEADFSTLQDPEREKLMLKALQFLYDTKKQKPTSITLRHTQTLTPGILKTLLHPGLRSLDLSYGALISDGGLGTSILSQIEALSSDLEELFLEGCPGLKKLIIRLPKLKRLNSSRCLNLVSLTVESTEIVELKISHSSELKTLRATLKIGTAMDWKETPNLVNQDFTEQLYQFGKQCAEGDGVPRDPERALTLWEKASAGKHLEAQFQLGRLYAKGDGVPRDPERALALWKKAALRQHRNAQEILEWIKKFGIKETLNLVMHKMREDAILADALFDNLSLASHKLRNIGLQGANTLADALKVNHTLVSLGIWDHQIRPQGVSAIADALKVNNTLVNLVLGGEKEKIGDQAAIAFGEALKVNNTLVSLELRGEKDEIGDQGATAFVEALKVNHSLTYLYLGRELLFGDRYYFSAHYSLSNPDHVGNQFFGEANAKAIQELISENIFLLNSALVAAKKGDVQLIHFLDQGVSIYSLDKELNTFLHLIAANGHMHLLQPLLKRYHNPTFLNWKNKEGKTALDLARENHHTDIEKLLLRVG